MKASRTAALAALLMACAAVPALSGRRAHLVSSTRAFSFDGAGYILTPSEEGDFSLVRRELARSGIRVDAFGEESPPHPALAFALRREGRDLTRWRTSLPRPFQVRHTLVLQAAAGPVGIAFGQATRPYDSSIRLLASRGFRCDAQGEPGKRRCLADRSSGKEQALVLLEEDGRFLFLRRLEK